MSHERPSLFGHILAWTARLTHLSMDWTVFLWYLASLFAFLIACWMLAATCFESPRARWCAVLVVAAVMTMPATNTGLLLMDPYLTPRSFTTPLILVALVFFLRRRYVLTAITTAITACIHPQMTFYLLFLTAVLWLAETYGPATRKRVPVLPAFAAPLPTGFRLIPAQGPYREALYARDFYFLSNWTWYHWIGMLAPLAFLAWFWKGKLRGTTPAFARLSFSLIPFGLLSILAAAVFSSSRNMDSFARLQPLRAFHLITLVFVVFLGGLVGEYIGKGRPWGVATLFLGLACGMYLVARQTYPFSPQVEGPWLENSSNGWVTTLVWIRKNTPESAVFAVDSRYFKDERVDVHGFRTISERAALADYFKDGGAVAIFPALAVEWKQMSDATYGLNHFSKADFMRLASEYPVTWTVIHGPPPRGMECPYRRDGYSVCRIPAGSAMAKTVPASG